MPMDCIFCRIIEGTAPGQILYRDEWVTAFRDIHPVAPTHVLIVPNKHIDSINKSTPQDEPVLGHLFTVARKLSEQEDIQAMGYRLIVNTGPHSGQAVFHVHMHLIGGQRMRFPMG